jgi:F-type H+-transporting ATPase subunit b
MGNRKGFKMESDSLIVWVNLLIVVLLLAKFAAKPVMDFIKGHKKTKQPELSFLEKEKEKISRELDKTMRTINEKKSLLADTEENITRQGEILKAGIIKEAGIESKLILEKAKQEAEKEIKQATEKLRTEVINEVFDKVSATKPNSSD